MLLSILIQAMLKQIKNKRSGFTLIEIIYSLVFISFILVVAIKILPNAVESIVYTSKLNKLDLAVIEKLEQTKNVSYWIWDVDTDNPKFPGNTKDPAVEWKNRLLSLNIDNRGEIAVTFQKDSGGNLVDFGGPEFDGNEDRNKIKVEVKLYTAGGIIKKETYIMAYPNQQILKGILNTIRRSLEIYYIQNGSYPPSNGLELLVPDYLAEIPNNPYTPLRDKTSHIEEKIDYYYKNAGGTITLAPHSHRDWGITWSY